MNGCNAYNVSIEGPLCIHKIVNVNNNGLHTKEEYKSLSDVYSNSYAFYGDHHLFCRRFNVAEFILPFDSCIIH